MARTAAGLVAPTPGHGALAPIGLGAVRVTGGLWADLLASNRARTIPHGFAQLEASGALDNFRNAARGSGRYVGGLDDVGITFPFLDSDVYKWLEAVGWELGRQDDAGLRSSADTAIALVAAAQRPDGYLNTFVQLSGRQRFGDLQWGHELYCIGHLIQAAVAWRRAVGDDRLLAVAERAVGPIEQDFGPAGGDGVDGHPGIEMALVELYRLTGAERYLALARHQVEQRGRGLLGAGRFGPGYWQDVEPVRRAPTVTGHAVRQLYLDAGAVDVAVETGDAELLDAVIRRWRDMRATRTHITGGVGSRHRDEAFGAPYELPPDRAYTETCAAIASVMLGWRLLLATGDPTYADAIERALYNAVLPGRSLDGTRFCYVNPLQRRAGEPHEGHPLHLPWYPCACCPPNLMRTLASFEQLVASDADGLRIHQYVAGRVTGRIGTGTATLTMDTDYPWDGRVELRIDETADEPWALELRIPAWCTDARVTVDGGVRRIEAGDRSVSLRRSWQPGETVTLELAMPARLTSADHRIDAVRGTVAIERGPLVYCLEAADLPAGTSMADVAIDGGAGLAVGSGLDALPGITTVATSVVRCPPDAPADWPYADRGAAPPAVRGRGPASIATAVPYFAWANRGVDEMRIWIPLAPADPSR